MNIGHARSKSFIFFIYTTPFFEIQCRGSAPVGLPPNPPGAARPGPPAGSKLPAPISLCVVPGGNSYKTLLPVSDTKENNSRVGGTPMRGSLAYAPLWVRREDS